MELISPASVIFAPEDAKKITVDIPLVAPTDPIHHQLMEEFNFEKPPTDPVKLYDTLAESLLRFKGLGLSAPQLGLPYRAFVIWSDPIRAFFNPIIVDKSNETIEMEEGCLTYPGLFVKITRARGIRVRYANPLGEVVTEPYVDMTARVIQHEMDHMNGIPFAARVKPMELDIAMRKAKKMTGHHYQKRMFKL